MSEQKRRVFPESFKRAAVERVKNNGLSATTAVAAELDLHSTVLRRWVRKYSAEPERSLRVASHQERLEAFLARRRLRLHPVKTRIVSTRKPAQFPGYELWRHGRRRLPPENVARLRNRLRGLRDRWRAGRVTEADARQRVNAWIARASQAHTAALRHALFADGWFDPSRSPGLAAGACARLERREASNGDGMRTVGFFSYTRSDDEANDGFLSRIRERLEREVGAEFGYEVEIFQDRDDIKTGEDWRERLKRALNEANYLITVLTPSFFNSGPCREELAYFIAKAADLKRPDLILPVLWRGVPRLEDPAARAADPLLDFAERRQYRDWRAHNFKRAFDIALDAEVNALARDLAIKLHADARATAPAPASAAMNLELISEQRQAELVKTLFEGPPPATPPRPSVSFPVPEMIRIAPGSFLMGSDLGDPGAKKAEQPKHRVRIDYGFEIGKYAVAFDEYDAFCEKTGREKPGDWGWGRGRRPVIRVNVADAEAYCAWLSRELGHSGDAAFRLPSEAEWEYCCRAGTSGPFSFDGPISTDLANYNGNYTFEGSRKGAYRERTVEVGSLPANPWGLHEAHGNVWEWCADCWNGSYHGAPPDGAAWKSGDCSKAVLRGGSWSVDPQYLRSAFRGGFARDDRDSFIGFRVARTHSGD